MGYLDNSTVTVDAILTNKGRALLAAGSKLNITKFALSDDEIDYDLWNPAHTLGTNYYGAVIENMPVLEALPDETQMMRYKLVTLPKTAVGIPVINPGYTSIGFDSIQTSATIAPITENDPTANNSLGFTLILSDSTLADVVVTSGVPNTSTLTAEQQADQLAGLTELGSSVTSFLDDEALGASTSGNTITKTGLVFKIIPKPVPDGQVKRGLITIIGNETGGFKTIPVTVTGRLTTNILTGTQSNA